MTPKQSILLRQPKNYPALFHYTHEQNVPKILESGSLLASPTWNFPDTNEYRHGLTLMRDVLHRALFVPQVQEMMRQDLTPSYGEYLPPIEELLAALVTNLQYELDNLSNPRVKVYVACLSTEPDSQKMKELYGPCVISFNYLISTLAIFAPRPFTSAMLSRVSYSDDQFLAYLPLEFRSIVQFGDGYEQYNALKNSHPSKHLGLVAGWLTERLCLFAPNIKKPDFQHEHEWRLKSAISSYPINPLRGPQDAAFLGLSEEATFMDIGGRNRYVQRLMFRNTFIQSGISLPPDASAETRERVDNWQTQQNKIPDTFDEFSQQYAHELT